MSSVLDGLLVLEFSAILAGPYCGAFLADQGAGMTDEERRALPIGPASQVIDALRAYEPLGVDGIIFQGLPNNPRLYERLAAEVIPALS